MLYGGNYEYLCVRHRETQTLFISDILHVPCLSEPAYGKVQTALYIAALEDAVHRSSLDGDVNGETDAKGRSGGMSSHSRPQSRGRPKKRQRSIDDPQVSSLNLCRFVADIILMC